MCSGARREVGFNGPEEEKRSLKSIGAKKKKKGKEDASFYELKNKLK